jgi:hypothetical protein
MLQVVTVAEKTTRAARCKIGGSFLSAACWSFDGLQVF